MRKFKVGDRVKIVRRVTTELGWDNGWTEGMDQYIGTIHTVRGYDYLDGYKLDNIIYGWPESAFELVRYSRVESPRRDNMLKLFLMVCSVTLAISFPLLNHYVNEAVSASAAMGLVLILGFLLFIILDEA